MRKMRTIHFRHQLCILLLVCSAVRSVAQDAFRVFPYLQYPASDAVSVLWFSNLDDPGVLVYRRQGEGDSIRLISEPVLATALAYSSWEDSSFFAAGAPPPPFRHSVRLVNLDASTSYEYHVQQGGEVFYSVFKTAPREMDSIRLIIYADSETEPESTGKHAAWPDPFSVENRDYLVDQTSGYGNNLEVIRSRKPDLVLIAGDLVQHGGEQRDWDEFWRHNTNRDGRLSLAAQVPLVVAPGNHEYYEGTWLDAYNQPGSERAMARYLTYFESPKNLSPNPRQEGRYYHLLYGQLSIIVLDLCNNGPNGSDSDTNFSLLGESDQGGGEAPDFMPGSRQYVWLEEQLAFARENSLFTFVMFHHIPYSSGPHGYPPGTGVYEDDQSGVPARILTPLFLKYGVDAVFCGHDEMWERSELAGEECLPDGSRVMRRLSFYDVGTGGDGLRGPEAETTNLYRKFLAHEDAPEYWEGGQLQSGGKHYGHLEVNIVTEGDTAWRAELVPVYVMPKYTKPDSAYTAFERREYADVMKIRRKAFEAGVNIPDQPVEDRMLMAYPNPFDSEVTFDCLIPGPEDLEIILLDEHGRNLGILRQGTVPAGHFSYTWNGCLGSGMRLSPGLYFYRASFGSGRVHTGKLVFMPNFK